MIQLCYRRDTGEPILGAQNSVKRQVMPRGKIAVQRGAYAVPVSTMTQLRGYPGVPGIVSQRFAAMEFLEFLTVAMVCVLLPAIILYNIRRIKEAKYLSKSEREGSALRTSELEIMIEEAVRRAVQPLLDRIEVGEGEPAGSLEALRPPLLGDEFAEFDDEEEFAVVGRRVRN